MGMTPIRIAGAGLAGLSAAIGLARRGYRVDVFEKNADSGQARHTDWDAIENWTTEEDLLDLLGTWGIAPSFEHRSKLDFEVYDQQGPAIPSRRHGRSSTCSSAAPSRARSSKS
jgi:2-polyprenyl-6-methoxyphenol hydroxylase-like FAD-dependent oxidoreductase